jgi:hypothetical protein
MNNTPWPWEPIPEPVPRKPLTVAEAIAILQTMPPDATLLSEGCDCIEDCMRISYDASDNTVLMER